MKIELIDNKKVILNTGESKKEIPRFWLRERLDGEEFLDKGTQQRLFDPSSMNCEVVVEKAKISDGFIEINFKSHPGSTNKFWLPTTRDQGNKVLDDFLKNKINLFGDYEDAVSKKSNVLFHSTLSPLINVGLITPMEILEKIKKIDSKVRLNSLEGYVRQIIGWREFMRGIYQNFNEQMENKNFFNHKKKFIK